MKKDSQSNTFRTTYRVPIFHSFHSDDLVQLLRRGAVGVIPTDTIYGISASAMNPKSIERIYEIRGRDRVKPFIVLIHSLDDLDEFEIDMSAETRHELQRIWPAPVSIVLPCPHKKFQYLHRGTKSIAFRLPASQSLRTFLKKTGPLVSTSANAAEKKPARTIAEAKKYFGDSLDFYVDNGQKVGSPSALLQYTKDGFTILRSGTYTSLFQQRVFDVVKKIPKGETRTYKEVARAAGSPRAYRAVGNILNKNYDPAIPCHRVIRSDGKTGGYNRTPQEKKRVLDRENAKI